jgi:hypothetical protein
VRQIAKKIFTTVTLMGLFAVGTATAMAQVDSIVGKYVGTAKSAGSPDAEISMELTKTGDKITGQVTHGDMKLEVTEGTLSEGKLTLKFGPGGKDGTLVAKLDGVNLNGEWSSGSQKKTVELKRVGESSPAAVNLSGQWDGVADAQGQPFPFLLTLKIDGEKVTGSSSSQLGEAQISSGSWKDGKLNFQLEGGSGVITMSAVVIDGKLSGDFDYAGQAQGKWVAVRKN